MFYSDYDEYIIQLSGAHRREGSPALLHRTRQARSQRSGTQGCR